MRCLKCNTQYVKKFGTITLCDPFIGNYKVEGIFYYECSSCNNRLFPRETSIKISERERDIRNDLIEKLPIGEFVSATEAANILEISRQALHKNRRIKNGFIYYTEKGGKRFYHKKSIVMFKRKGDGRFNLAEAILPQNNWHMLIEDKFEFSTGNWQKNEFEEFIPSEFVTFIEHLPWHKGKVQSADQPHQRKLN